MQMETKRKQEQLYIYIYIRESEVKSLSRVRLFATPQTVAYQAPSMGFSRQENWSGVPFPSPDLQRIFLTQGSNPGLPHCRQTLYHLSHQGSLCISEKTDLKPKTVAKTKKFSLYNGKGIILTRGYSSCKQLCTQHETT